MGGALRAPHAVDPGNTEDSALTIWLGLSRQETSLLVSALRANRELPLHAAILATFAGALLDADGDTHLAVDIESHGRLALDRSVDISRVVGWFTSIYPLTLPANDGGLDAVRSVAAMIAEVPQLGIAYGMFADALPGAPRREPVSTLCFNYLGEFHLPRGQGLALAPSRYSPGCARGGANNRVHPLKFTARIFDGHLVADLSFAPAAYPLPRMRQVMAETRRRLLALVDLTGAPMEMLVEEGTSTGLVHYAPAALMLEPPPPGARPYKHVLLTGANGYVGVHLLHELLRRTDAHVYCLVRAKDGISARQRLDAALSWYLPAPAPSTYAHRYTVIEGDVAQERFGLANEIYASLGTRLDAIYHSAANTRLVGGAKSFQQNVDSVRAAIALAKHRRLKDLHYMSTLAVCGVNASPATITFSETSLDIGQEFQNEYERSKFAAERLVQDFAAAGGSAFIYRSGNISGHSATGKFQRNAADNRFVQLLAAAVKVGKLPRDLGENIVLSPVDKVAAGIASISLTAALGGGVFHVDSPWDVEMREIFEVLKSLGLRFDASHYRSFEELFGAHQGLRDAGVALGYFWAKRKPRNVRFDHERSLRTLESLDCRFDRPSRAWIRRFLQHLVHCRALPEQRAASDPDLAAAFPEESAPISEFL
jgi:thioester reductase-like protein/non-ribosomal peptide synthase protein (TIGR01720 family)